MNTAIRWRLITALSLGVLLGIYLAHWLEFGLHHSEAF